VEDQEWEKYAKRSRGSDRRKKEYSQKKKRRKIKRKEVLRQGKNNRGSSPRK